MAQSNLEIVIKAQDEASDKLKGIAESAKGMGIAFTAAGAVITGALAFAIKQASDAQIQMQGVDTTLAALKSSAQEAASKVADNGNEMKMSALKAQELQLKISDIEKKYKSSGAALDDNGQSLDKNAIKLAIYKNIHGAETTVAQLDIERASKHVKKFTWIDFEEAHETEFDCANFDKTQIESQGDAMAAKLGEIGVI
jgi:hypothetical protein